MLMSRPAVTDCWRTSIDAVGDVLAGITPASCASGGRGRCRRTSTMPAVLAVDEELELVVAVDVVHAAHDRRAALPGVTFVHVELRVAADVRAPDVLERPCRRGT